MNEVLYMVEHNRFEMNEYLAKTVLEKLPFVVLLVNMHGHVCYMNESGKNFLKYSESELGELSIEEIILSDEQGNNAVEMNTIPPIVREKAKIMDSLTFCKNRKGDVLLVDVKVKKVNLWNGPYNLYTFTDMTPYRQECESATSQAHTDSLTNVYNRRGFDVYLDHQIDAYKRTGTSLALMFLDIDDFKRINDIYGHYYGDEVLVILTSIIKNTCRDIDIVCRYGGDELAVLLPGTTVEVAQKITDRILGMINMHVWSKGRVTSSIGLTVLQTDEYRDREASEVARAMVTCADSAMYESKQLGKNCLLYRPFAIQVPN